MRNFNFKKHGDYLLFALALAVLAGVLINFLVKGITQVTAPQIVFSHYWQNDLEEDTLDTLVKEFKSLHGNINITLNDASCESIRRDLFSPDNPDTADVFALDPLWVTELLEMGVIENAWAEEPRFDPKVPILSFINVLYYNIEVLKDAGFIHPPKTRNEFMACAKVLGTANHDAAAGKKIYALAMGAGSSRGIYDDIYPWIWAAGVQLIRDGKQIINSRVLAENLSFLAALNSEGFIVPGAFQADSQKKLEDFISGKAAFMIAPISNIAIVRERMGEEAFGISSIPLPDQLQTARRSSSQENYSQKPFFASSAWTVGVNSASPHKEEAILFASFLSGKAAFLSEKAKAVPGAASPAAVSGTPDDSRANGRSSSFSFLIDPFYSKAWDIAIAGENARDFDGLPWSELEEIFKEKLRELFEGKSTAAAAAQAIQTEWKKILEKVLEN